MGAALHNALFPNHDSKVALLNIGSEEIKGHETIKKNITQWKIKKMIFINFVDI